METKKMQQPLLYIQQPDFEKLIAPMQQYFISKKPIKEKSNAQDISETIQNHETDDSKVMEFILEGILSTKEDDDLIENVSKRSALIGEPNTIIELKRKKKVSSDEVETMMEDTEQSPPESKENLNEKKKKKKRTPFNGLSLVDKLNELRKLPNNFAKVLYEFVTIEKTYSGYFLSFKNDGILIQPKSSKQTIKIPEHQITNIKIIGF